MPQRPALNEVRQADQARLSQGSGFSPFGPGNQRRVLSCGVTSGDAHYEKGCSGRRREMGRKEARREWGCSEPGERAR